MTHHNQALLSTAIEAAGVQINNFRVIKGKIFECTTRQMFSLTSLCAVPCTVNLRLTAKIAILDQAEPRTSIIRTNNRINTVTPIHNQASSSRPSAAIMPRIEAAISSSRALIEDSRVLARKILFHLHPEEEPVEEGISAIFNGQRQVQNVAGHRIKASQAVTQTRYKPLLHYPIRLLESP